MENGSMLLDQATASGATDAPVLGTMGTGVKWTTGRKENTLRRIKGKPGITRAMNRCMERSDRTSSRPKGDHCQRADEMQVINCCPVRTANEWIWYSDDQSSI
ncbi:hypothetical protein Y032_0102g3444 [Ancylostoma ceylanicum]|uniref:Uncharacterized protein n=1 Tax=Ancylostoma ceylanicum TaxID=53326 RepID=A0A016THI4_9BILA|nr:hypothetical protein Y032_0102g3444 [Ancylostoma ceylanicum]